VLIRSTFISIALCFNANIVTAKEVGCNFKGIHLGFFNGVGNTPKQAFDSLEATFTDLSLRGFDISDKQFYYNETKYHGAEDIVEVFNQRLNEEFPPLSDRMELFFQTLRNGKQSQSLSTASRKYLEFATSFRRYMTKVHVNTLSRLISVPTEQIYKNHQKQLDVAIKNKQKLLLVAHSQGNLFVNKAYAYAKPKAGGAIGVLHVAPASVKLNGPHILADYDLVIDALRAFGPVPGYTDTIGAPPRSWSSDLSGHGYLDIYLNPKSSTYEHFNKEVASIFNDFDAKCADSGVQRENGVDIAPLKSKYPPLNFSLTCSNDVPCKSTTIKMALSLYTKELASALLPHVQKVETDCAEKSRWRMVSGEWNRATGSFDISCGGTDPDNALQWINFNSMSVPFTIDNRM
jgi:hypothetical protein